MNTSSTIDECDSKLTIGTRSWMICKGMTSLPLYKVNFYRRMWGVSELDESDSTSSKPAHSEYNYLNDVEVTVHGYSVSGGEPTSHTPHKPYGPGTELLRIYEAAGVPSCQACKDLAQQMNDWGVDLCRKNIDSIVKDILPRAIQWVAENHSWVHSLLPNYLEESAISMKIRSDVLQAIEVADQVIRERKKQHLDVYTGAVKTRKCCQ